MKWESLSPELKRKLIRENPKDLNAAGIIPAVGAQKPEPVRRGQSEDRGVEEVPTCLGYRITIVSLCRRLVDAHDNLRFSYKPAADRIAAYLGFKSDDDPKLEWNYLRVLIKGAPGTIVQIDPIVCVPKSSCTSPR